VTVHVAGYQAVSILHGGPRTQIEETVRHLNQIGVTTTLFDPWAPFHPAKGDLFHLYAANIGTYHLAREIRALGLPLVVSPITYSSHTPGFIRNALSVTRAVQKRARGIWSDYGLCAEICSWARMVLPNTQAEADLLIQGYGVSAGNVRVIPNGVDEVFTRADPDLFVKTYGLRNFILNVGHTGHERKNVLRMIRALGPLNCPVVIIGRIIKSSYGDACVREAARYKHILLLDGIDHSSPMLASAYAACDVFVLPSLFETPGIAALEAGLAGAKVVITPHGGTREYFRDMADYVEPLSEASIRRGVESALGRKKDERLKQHIAAHYLWRHVAEQTAEAYNEVATDA
jgi:glycosyltransferase involved in cell wall biosynthesis